MVNLTSTGVCCIVRSCELNLVVEEMKSSDQLSRIPNSRGSKRQQGEPSAERHEEVNVGQQTALVGGRRSN